MVAPFLSVGIVLTAGTGPRPRRKPHGLKHKPKGNGIGRTVAVIGIVIVIAAIAYFGLTAPAPDRPTAQKGGLAPDFTLRDMNSVQIRLSDFRGKVVVLEFMETKCPFCAQQMPNLVDLWRAYGASVVIISVSIDIVSDTNEVLRDYAQRYNAGWIFARDTGNVMMTYQIAAVPTTFIIDVQGYVAVINRNVVDTATLLQQVQAAQK